MRGPKTTGSDPVQADHDAYSIHPFGIEAFLGGLDLELVRIGTVEGLPAQPGARVNGLDEATFGLWVDLVDRTIDDPCTWGASDHLLAVARKPAPA